MQKKISSQKKKQFSFVSLKVLQKNESLEWFTAITSEVPRHSAKKQKCFLSNMLSFTAIALGAKIIIHKTCH